MQKVGIRSFAHKTKWVTTVHFVIDATSFRDPTGNEFLRKNCVNGLDAKVREWIAEDSRFNAMMDTAVMLAQDADSSNIPWISIGYMDHHGRWSSVALAEEAARRLKEKSFEVITVHHGLPA